MDFTTRGMWIHVVLLTNVLSVALSRRTDFNASDRLNTAEQGVRKELKKAYKTLNKALFTDSDEAASGEAASGEASSAEALQGWTMPEDWVQYISGRIPIVISSPHNGQIKPEGVPLRNHGCWVDGECVWKYDCANPDPRKCHAETLADMNSLRIAKMMTEILEDTTGARPYLVYNNLHRSFLDANRRKPEAADGIPMMEVAYDTFFEQAKLAHDAVEQKCGKGLWIDVHGHTQNQYVMLGYDFPVESFRFKNKTLDAKLKYAADSTIRALSKDHPEGYTFSQLLRGDVSLGSMLEKEGVETVPSPTLLDPQQIEGEYLDGATIINRYGSQSKGTVDAVQMEIPSHWRNGYDNVKAPKANRQFAEKAVRAILAFVQAAYGWAPDQLASVCAE